MPNFSTDSNYEESWTDCNDLEIQREEDDWDVGLELPAGEEEEQGENRELSQNDKRSTAIPQTKVNFEFEEEGCDVRGCKLVDSLPYSRLGEEESMEVVADSFDMFPEASDLGGRVEAGLMENRPQKKLTSDPIEISTGNNLGLQLKPNLKTPRQACDGEKEEGKENWASDMKDNVKKMTGMLAWNCLPAKKKNREKIGN
ncbi:hypothetical protein SLA2020_016930 [Shorea laevis]